MSLLKTYEAREAGYGQEYNAHLSRKTTLGGWFLRKFIVPNTLRRLEGKVVDFGCGVGELLRRCPPGSIGLEINLASVEQCRRAGMTVLPFDPEVDQYRFTALEPGAFQTFLMSHVLEHIPNTADVLGRILASCQRLGFQRLLFKVPGALMYERDKTHVTFVDRGWLSANRLLEAHGFAVTEISYYPFNVAWLGRFSPIHETLIVYERSR